MKRLIAGIIILLVVLGALFAFQHYKGQQKLAVFDSVPVEQGSINSSITATGTLNPIDTITVGSEVSGVVKKIYVEYNSQVKKGQILAELNKSTIMTEVDKATSTLKKAQASYANSKAQVGNCRAAVRKAEANLATAEAKTKQAQANVANSQASLANSQSAVLTAEANVRKNEAELGSAKSKYRRNKALLAEDLISQSEFDAVNTTLQTTIASLEASQSSLQSAQASERSSQASLEAAKLNLQGVQSDEQAARINIDAAREQLAAAEASAQGSKAEVEQAQASLDQVNVQLGKTTIKSPIDGVILSILVSEGQTLNAGMTAPELFKLAENLNAMQVETTVDEADIAQIRPGNKVNFTVDAWPDEEFTGEVSEVRQSASTTNNVVTYPVIVTTNNDNLHLMPGMTATVSIIVDQCENVLYVPNTALRFKPEDSVVVDGKPYTQFINDLKNSQKSTQAKEGGKDKEKTEVAKTAHIKTVYTLTPGKRGELTSHQVAIGLSDGTYTQLIESDLKEGDRVVTGTKETSLADIKKNSQNNGRRGPHGPGPF